MAAIPLIVGQFGPLAPFVADVMVMCMPAPLMCIQGLLSAGFTLKHVADIADDLKERSSVNEDSKLLAKMMEDDCGALSKMSKNVEGCYRKYLSEAVLRAPVFQNKFEECFGNRPEQTCGDWFFRTNVF